MAYTYRVTLPNGKSYKVSSETPLTPEQAQDQVMVESKAPSRSLGDYLSMGGRAVTEAVGDIAEVAEMATPSGMIALARGREPPQTKQLRQYVRKGADIVGLEEPVTPKEKIVSAGVRGAAGALVPVVGARTLAGRGATLARRPILQAISGALAGVGGESAKLGGAGPVGQFLTSIVAGVLPATAIGAGAKLFGAGRAHFSKGGITERSARIVQKAAADKPATIAALRGRPKPSPETVPTTAEVARDPGLAALQRARLSTAITERQRANAIVRARTAETALEPGSPRAVQTLATGQGRQNLRQVEAARKRVGPVVERLESGTQIRTVWERNYTKARQATDRAYSVPALKVSKPVQLPDKFHSDIVKSIKPFLGDGAEPLPKALETIIEDLRAPGATTARFANIDSRLADFAGEAKLVGRNRDALVANTLRQTLQRHEATFLSPEALEALKKARGLRAEQGRRFEQGNAAKAFAMKQFGEPAKDAPELPGALVRKGAVGGSTIDRLMAAVGPKASEATARQELRRLADEGQLTTPAQLRGFGELLTRFPGLKDDVRNLHNRIELNNAFVKSPLGKVVGTDVDVSTALDGVLTSKDNGLSFTQLAGQVRGNKPAQAGLRGVLANYIRKEGMSGDLTVEGLPIPSNDKTLAAIDLVLERGKQAKLLTKSQQTVLGQIRQELAGVNYARTAGVAEGVSSSQPLPYMSMGMPLPGKGAVRTTLAALASHFDNTEEVNMLVERALLDPEKAVELLSVATPDRLKQWKNIISASGRASALVAVPEQETE